jgi:hypothetical protein
MANTPQQRDLHHEILELLLDKVRDDPYPSVTMLNMIEESLRSEDVPEYTDILIEKVRADQFPSLDHLHRLQRFA